MNAQLLEAGPIGNRNVGVNQGRLHQVGERCSLPLWEFGAEIRDHPVVAGENAVLRAHAMQFASAHVCDLDFFGMISRSDVADVDNRAVEADADRGARLVEAAILGAGGNDVVHGVARDAAGHESADQHAGDGR